MQAFAEYVSKYGTGTFTAEGGARLPSLRLPTAASVIAPGLSDQLVRVLPIGEVDSTLA